MPISKCKHGKYGAPWYCKECKQERGIGNFEKGITMSNESKDESAFAMDSKNGTYHAGLSKIEYAAIHLRVPDSGTKWLDEMIQKARRDEFAKHIAHAYFGDPAIFQACGAEATDSNIAVKKFIAEAAYEAADALIKAADEGMGK